MSKFNVDYLKDFFSAYFHEDWMMESEDPMKIVETFRSTVNVEHRIKLSNEIKKYVDAFEESGSEISLLEELGCYYDPQTDGIAKKEWLLAVAKVLYSP